MPLPHSSVHAPFPCFCELSIAQSRSMPLPLSYRVELHHEHLSFQSLSRAQCLCHTSGTARPSGTTWNFQSLSRAQCLCHGTMRRYKANTISIFQSLSRAQCLCHGNVSLYQVLQGTFNRSVALNAFATMCARLPLQWPQHSFNRSVALNAFATPCE